MTKIDPFTSRQIVAFQFILTTTTLNGFTRCVANITNVTDVFARNLGPTGQILQHWVAVADFAIGKTRKSGGTLEIGTTKTIATHVQ